MMEKLMKSICEELEEAEKKGLSAANLDSTDKLLNMKKNLMKIENLEEESGYSMDGGWEARGSYGRGSYRGGGNSYARGRKRDSMGRYSSRDYMMSELDSMMSEASSEKEKDILRRAMREFENA